MSSLFTLSKLLLKASRPKHWTKNLLVFAAPLFSFQPELLIWLKSLQALISFCLLSSAVYIFNDVIDAKSDRLHPIKKYRPIASKSLNVKIACIFSIILILTSFYIGFIVENSLLLILSLYLFIQIIYCIKLKEEPIFDLMCISSGFLLRAISGGISSDLIISPWFLLSIGFLALFLALEKRKAEIRSMQSNHIITRKVLNRYSLPLLLRLESLVASSSFVTYSLWAAGPALKGAKTSWMLLTVPFVLIGIFQYQLLSDPDEASRRKDYNSTRTPENPEEILLQDKGIRITVISWLLTTIFIGITTS
tara:strand:+ start:294 stop:1214 length:921 start_codon:yes stop_codon:yes gene_type:complete